VTGCKTTAADNSESRGRGEVAVVFCTGGLSGHAGSPGDLIALGQELLMPKRPSRALAESD
jgi:hypothetical protein